MEAILLNENFVWVAAMAFVLVIGVGSFVLGRMEDETE
jgi:hypothetical protein